ncbi:MAG: metalloregulator ArsR/SmtB family transcription factor [Longimicrobiales bacterium]
MSNTFELLADETRRSLVEALGEGEHSVGELVDRVEMAQPAVSKQLRILREAGLASVRKEGRRRIYRLQPQGLKELDTWLQPFRAAWERRVDALEEVLSSTED